MPKTVADLIAKVRHNTNDSAASVRVVDATIVGFVNDGRREVFSIRPDMKPYPRSASLAEVTGASSLDDMSDKAYSALQYYVTSRVEMADDQHVNSNRMAQAMTEFKNKLVSNQ